MQVKVAQSTIEFISAPVPFMIPVGLFGGLFAQFRNLLSTAMHFYVISMQDF